jgi:undecaprenyl diphosphate synthase
LNSSAIAGTDTVLDPRRLPAHVAIIMDGNGRWAKLRRLDRVKGHHKGESAVRSIVRTCREIGISFLTLFAFSTENWERPEEEVKALMRLLKKFLKSELKELLENNIRLNAIGQLNRLPEDSQKELNQTMLKTRENDGMVLTLALSYGGRADITRAVKRIVIDALENKIDPEKITPEFVSGYLYTHNLPDPDLLIRTGAESRISNFLLWQIAYSEIFVTDTLWPDFSKEEFIAILKNYQGRERRFGKIPA